MHEPRLRTIGIAGAGLLGRLLAWQLARQGHAVSVFDPAQNAAPQIRSAQADTHATMRTTAAQPAYTSTALATAAAFTAAGMLSPIAELDNSAPEVAALGWRSLDLWSSIAAQLPQAPGVARRGSLLLAHPGDLGSAQHVLHKLQSAMHTPIWRALSPDADVQALDTARLQALEPALQSSVRAWLLPGEGCLDTVAMMAALHAAASASGAVQWHWGIHVQSLETQSQQAWLHCSDGRARRFDAVIDVRGIGAKNAVHGGLALRLRGLRGEILQLDCPEHGLTRPTRLLHPRHRVYLVPRSPREIILGASEIESEDRSPVSVRSACELMTAAYSIMPRLAEARITALDVNLRPATPDHRPIIIAQGQLLAINGLYRHGWLLAPALLEQAQQRCAWLTLGPPFNLQHP